MTSDSDMRVAGYVEGAEFFKKYTLMPRRRMSYDCVVPRNFATLSIPILVKIFGYVDNHDLLRNVSFVCRHWRYAVMQPELIKTFRVINGAMTLPYVYNHLRKFKQTTRLYIQDVADPMDILPQAAKFLSDLKELHLVNCGDLNFDVIAYIVKAFPALDTLDFEETNFEDYCNVPQISNLENIKSLNINKVKNLSMQDIMETVLNCKLLEEINIGLLPPQVDLTDADACLIVGNLSAKLKSLTIDARSLTSLTFERIFECKLLKKLCINFGVNLTTDFFTKLWEELPLLVEIGFKNNRAVTFEHIKILFGKKKSPPRDIISIDLSHCILIDDSALDVIAHSCRKLKRIELKSCKRITNIAPLCANCKELKFLNVAFCDDMKTSFDPPKKLEVLITHQNDGLQSLLHKFRHFKHLRVFTALSEYTDHLKRLNKITF